MLRHRSLLGVRMQRIKRSSPYLESLGNRRLQVYLNSRHCMRENLALAVAWREK